jgi:enhancing lycopene biosynthesis protein 2
MAKRVAVILSGCGVQDGAEIHESVLTLFFLDRAGVEIVCAAPNVSQAQVVNHLTGELQGGERNVLVESARIARGQIRDLDRLGVAEVDAAIFPGGYGAAKNLSSWALEKEAGRVEPKVARFVREMAAAGKPLGFICIAPVIAAKVLGGGVTVTIGNDPETAASIERMGGRHQVCVVGEVAIDRERKVVTTPAYMLANGPAQAGSGIERLCKVVLELC